MPAVRYPIEMVNGLPVVTAPPEIDASNADWLRTTLLETAARGYATFVVDMTRTRLCASAGIGALVQGHKRALAEGGELRLLMPTSAAVLSVFASTGTDRLIPSFTDLDQALQPAPAAAIRSDRDSDPDRAMRTPWTGCRPRLSPDPALPEGYPVRYPAPAAAGGCDQVARFPGPSLLRR